MNSDASLAFDQDTKFNVGSKTKKFRDIKTQQNKRWKYIGQRHIDYEDYAKTCALLGDEPASKHEQGHLSAAKLKGSPEYTEKVNKMAERRAHVRTHEPDVLATNVRWCGCCTDKSAPEYMTRCCWCAEYGGPDMKRIPQDKWGSKYATVWTPSAKRRKIRPHDKPCAALVKYNQVWPRADATPFNYILKYGDPYDNQDGYVNIIINSLFYTIY